MVILNRKAAEQNPASTAALRRVATGLSSQRRALRHPAGAPAKAMNSAVEMKKRIREEIMNGTFEQQGFGGHGKAMLIWIGASILSGVLAVGSPAAMAGSADRPVDVSRNVDRAKVETLQRWVSAGHAEWCKDARLVAMHELRRVAPAFAGDAVDLEAVPMDEETVTENRGLFTWTSPDGRATYRVTVERFGWLLPIAGETDSIVWVPTHAEVIAHR